MKHYTVVDLINGLERYDGYTPEYYKSFSPSLMNRLQNYAVQGGRLFVSGSYLGSDMQTTEEKAFLANTLKVAYAPNDSIAPTADVEGLGLIMQPRIQRYSSLRQTTPFAPCNMRVEPVRQWLSSRAMAAPSPWDSHSSASRTRDCVAN